MPQELPVWARQRHLASSSSAPGADAVPDKYGWRLSRVRVSPFCKALKAGGQALAVSDWRLPVKASVSSATSVWSGGYVRVAARSMRAGVAHLTDLFFLWDMALICQSCWRASHPRGDTAASNSPGAPRFAFSHRLAGSDADSLPSRQSKA